MADYARNRMFFASSTALMLAVAAYMSFSLFWHAPIPPAWRVPLTCGLFLLSQSITAMRVVITRRPDLPFAVVRAGGFVSASFMTLSWLVLVRDALLAPLLLLSFFLPSLQPLRLRLFDALLSIPFELGMGAAALALAAIGMALALRVPPVRRVSVPVRGLAPELEGLHLVQLSDLHIGSTFGGDWLTEVVRRVNALEPDFVFITGDLADGTPERIGRHLRPLLSLRARYGVLASPGNHDYYSGLAPWVRTWRSWDLPFLLNEHLDFRVGGRLVRAAGVTDPCAVLFRSLGPNMGPPDTRRALRCTYTDEEHRAAGPADRPAPADLTILMAHRPGEAEQNAALGVDLQLSGHTHGGQFFFLFPLVSRMNRGFRSGLYRAGSMPLYVSPGTGMWGYVPMRFGSRSEISLLVLRQED
ncbi:metallophosphoesterase [Mailhella sp.]|uniref:metallophosphoesterase n=1 Tax=Mailhella sp. TaxID=1981029 RepID=UPI004064716A